MEVAAKVMASLDKEEAENDFSPTPTYVNVTNRWEVQKREKRGGKNQMQGHVAQSVGQVVDRQGQSKQQGKWPVVNNLH